jgi:hypothetical protein
MFVFAGQHCGRAHLREPGIRAAVQSVDAVLDSGSAQGGTEMTRDASLNLRRAQP